VLGLCEKGPRVTIYPDGISYFRVQTEDIDEIVSRSLDKGEPIERLLLRTPKTGRSPNDSKTYHSINFSADYC